MSNQTIPLFFDGKTSEGFPVNVVADDKKLVLHFVYSESGFQIVKEPLTFFYKDCTTAHVGEHLYVYVNKNGTSYIALPFTDPNYLRIRDGVINANPSLFGRLMRMHVGILAFVFVGLLVGGYFAVASFVPWVGLKIITPAEEKVMGEKLYQAFVGTEKVDTQKTRLVREFAASLTLSKTYNIDIAVLKDKEVNAFALPGGKVVVYTGILKSMKSADELAALLAHEVSHINKRHSLRSLLRSSAIAILISVALNDASGVAAILVENAETLRSLGYSRSLERDADYAGMQVLVNNKINPIAMRNLMLRLQEEYGRTPDVISFISTHPATSERIANANKFAKKYKADQFVEQPVLKATWDKIKE
jgi:beta-barrel assembly-enhancing protease